MIRIAMGLEYHGYQYCGWQKQHNGLAVQEVLELALSKVADHLVATVCAGRTDKGVHAVGQVIHFDTWTHRDDSNWLCGVNTYLPADVRVTWIKQVSSDFHARFSAISRRYTYCVYARNMHSALLAQHAVWASEPLNVGKMQQAANYWVGTHDFSAFRSSGCQAKNAVRQMKSIKVLKSKQAYFFKFTANAFLHHMVRYCMGVLLQVGLGKKEVIWAKTLLQSEDRCLNKVLAPAYGLYFMQVEYPVEYKLPIFVEKLGFYC